MAAKTESKPDKTRPNWGPVKAILLTITIYFGAQFIGDFLVLSYPIIKGWTTAQADIWLATSTWAQFWLILLIEAITLWLLWQFLKHNKGTWRWLGLIKPRLKDAGFALIGAAVYLPLVIASLTAVKSLIPSLNIDQKQQLGFQAAHSRPELFLVLISLVILPAVTEEIVMRGFLYTSLKSYWPKRVALLVTCVLFSVAHLQFGSGQPLLWVAAIDTFILSIVLVGLREFSGNLWPSIYLHLAKNALAFVSLFLVK